MGNSNSVASSSQSSRRFNRKSIVRKVSDRAILVEHENPSKLQSAVERLSSTGHASAARASSNVEEQAFQVSELDGYMTRANTLISEAVDEVLPPPVPLQSPYDRDEDSEISNKKTDPDSVTRSYTVNTVHELKQCKQETKASTTDDYSVRPSRVLASKQHDSSRFAESRIINDSKDSHLGVGIHRSKTSSSKRSQLISSGSIPLSPMIKQAVQDLEKIRNKTPLSLSTGPNYLDTPISMFSGTAELQKENQKGAENVLSSSVHPLSRVKTVNEDFILPIPTITRPEDLQSSLSSFEAPPKPQPDFSESITALAALAKLKKARSKKNDRIRTLASKTSAVSGSGANGSFGRGVVRSGFVDLEQQQFSLSRRSTAMHKFNSCSTLFIDSTLSTADLQKTLRCVATALAVNIRRNHELNILKTDEIFSEKLHPLSKHIQFYTRILSEEDIYKFLDCIFQAAELNVECAVITLVYIERMLINTGITLHSCNWARIVLGGLLLASKVWDDHAVWNVDFCQIFPDIRVNDMNELERWYMSAIQYNVSVKASVYARYYFELRDLLDTETRILTSRPLVASEIQQHTTIPTIQVEFGSSTGISVKENSLSGSGSGVTHSTGVSSTSVGFQSAVDKSIRRSRSDYAFVSVKPPAQIV
ncbi:hypothetical protein BC830DRAFT_1231258 [Chytriomyces sp. MP71]|nr:hypothetical protein BC830DRAFT_1231258 [Chytriomyces sp. MP71]